MPTAHLYSDVRVQCTAADMSLYVTDVQEGLVDPDGKDRASAGRLCGDAAAG